MRTFLIATLVAFLAIEGALISWLVATRTLAETWGLLGEPGVLIMFVDFTFVVAIIFGGVVVDCRKRGTNPWPWLPALLAVPTAAVVAYLLIRAPRPADE